MVLYIGKSRGSGILSGLVLSGEARAMREFLATMSGKIRLKNSLNVVMAVLTIGALGPANAAGDAASGSTTNKDGATGQIVLSGAQKTPLQLGSREETKNERYAKVKPENLRRLDFKVVGSGCAACLGRIRKRI